MLYFFKYSTFKKVNKKLFFKDITKMTSKETTLMALNLVVLYTLIGAVTYAPAMAIYVIELIPRFVMETATETESYWYVFWMIVVSSILIGVLVYILSWILKALIHIILSKETQNTLIEITPVRFELTILSVLGLYLFVNGVSVVTYDVWYFQEESKSSFFCGMGIKNFMTVLSYIIEIVVGLTLMLFPKKVALFLINIRRDY